MSQIAASHEDSIREEIDDLEEYLKGIPADLRAAGAFLPYEARLEDLKKEMAFEKLKQLDLPIEALVRLVTTPTLPEVHEYFASIERARLLEITRFTRASRWLSLGFLLATALSLIMVLSPTVSVAAGAAALAGVLAVLQLALDIPRRLTRAQQTADRLRAFRTELQPFIASSENQRPAAIEPELLAKHIVRTLSELSTQRSSSSGGRLRSR